MVRPQAPRALEVSLPSRLAPLPPQGRLHHQGARYARALERFEKPSVPHRVEPRQIARQRPAMPRQQLVDRQLAVQARLGRRELEHRAVHGVPGSPGQLPGEAGLVGEEAVQQEHGVPEVHRG